MSSTASSHYGSLDTVRPSSEQPASTDEAGANQPAEAASTQQEQPASTTATTTSGQARREEALPQQEEPSSVPPKPAVRQRQKQQQQQQQQMQTQTQIDEQLQQLKLSADQAAKYDSTALVEFTTPTTTVGAQKSLKFAENKMTQVRQPNEELEQIKQQQQVGAQTTSLNGKSDAIVKRVELASEKVGANERQTTAVEMETDQQASTIPSSQLVRQRNNLTKLGAIALALDGPQAAPLQRQQQQQQQPPPPPQIDVPERPYPKKVLFIVANEFCERFSYYGLRTVLVLYFRSVLGFNDAKSTVSFHLFATLCYLTPILGAILGDSVWGKFKTILYLSIVYFLGELVLVLSSVFWDLGAFSTSSTFIGLLMIGIGTGGIKPCVSALGGDQFLPSEDKRRQAFFSLFYGAINLGSLISMFVTPILRSDFSCVQRTDCYPYAFGLPCLLMFLAIVVFLLAKDQYHLVALPEKNIIIAFCQCVWLALKRKCCGQTLPQVQANSQLTLPLTDNTSSSSLSGGSSNEDVQRATLTIETANKIDGLFGQQNQQQEQQEQAASKELTLVARYETVRPIKAACRKGDGGNDNDDDDEHKKNGKRASESDSSTSAVDTSSSSINSSELEPGRPTTSTTGHWLYLASDRFDSKSIGEFKIVLGILLLFVPLPVYWCLFDQQSSLWTLQATRMDGRLFNTGFVIQPDQMSVANPLLLLTAIPIFELAIYPGLNRLNLLTSPIQRITTGGLLAALTFVLSAMIELRIQDYRPPVEPYEGRANLILVNGLSECSLILPRISNLAPTYTSGPAYTTSAYNATTTTTTIASIDYNASADFDFDGGGSLPKAASSANLAASQALSVGLVEPLDFKSFDVLSAAAGTANSISGYKLEFKLSSNGHQLKPAPNESSTAGSAARPDQTTVVGGCPFDPHTKHELNIGLLADKAVKLLYLEQGNGRLAYRLFNESLELPAPGKARVRLLYEFFGSSAQAEKRQFYLVRLSGGSGGGKSSKQATALSNSTKTSQHSSSNQLKFTQLLRDGQVIISSYMDVDVPENGDRFVLRTSEFHQQQQQQQDNSFLLEPGTRNLVIAQQKDASIFEIRRQLLQDNGYRISLLWQLGPYLLISISEVMFSITGLEFSYSMAPENMKSVILAAWSLTTAFGNILTVAVESLHLFTNIVHDFLFYATIMALDMVLFAAIGFYYKPQGAKRQRAAAK